MLNLVVVIGSLAKESQARQLPSGLSLVNFDLLVARPDHGPETVPIALFDAPQRAPGWSAGQEMVVVGRVRRRFFRVSGTTQSRTEVVADQVLPVGQKDSVRLALASAASRLDGAAQELAESWSEP